SPLPPVGAASMINVLSASLRLGFVVALLLVTSSIAHADVTNGDFEAATTPPVPAGNFTTFSVGSTGIPGWTVIGPNANAAVAVVSGTFSQAGVSFPAQEGTTGHQWVDLTGNGSNTTEGVSQAVATIAGHTYLLSDFLGNTTVGGIFVTTSPVNGSSTGVPFTNINSAVNATSLTWQQFTHTFVATGSTATLTFANGDPIGDNSNGLDKVTLTDQGVAGVPE